MPIPLMAAAGAASGLFKVAGSIFGSRGRKKRQQRAQEAFNARKEQYMNLDLSSLRGNQENMFEDLTVNQQAADFRTSQQNQALVNTQNQFSQAAGQSGGASLAQALVQQQMQNIASNAVTIGEQEQRNQMLAAREASRIQSDEIAGEEMARGAELERTETLLGMEGQELAAANQARQAATKQLFDGFGSIAGGVAAGGAGQGWFDQIFGPTTTG